MDRAAFTDEPAPERFKYRFDGHQSPPERICGLSIVRMVCHILIETNRLRSLDLYRPDSRLEPHAFQSIHHQFVKLGDGSGLERNGFGRARRALNDEVV